MHFNVIRLVSKPSASILAEPHPFCHYTGKDAPDTNSSPKAQSKVSNVFPNILCAFQCKKLEFKPSASILAQPHPLCQYTGKDAPNTNSSPNAQSKVPNVLPNILCAFQCKKLEF
jgi:hypothetical protein